MPQLLESILDQVRLTSVLDIGITAVLIYWLFSLIRGTSAVRLVIGVSVLFAVYFAARLLNLPLLTQILETGAVVGLFALVSWRAFAIGRRCVDLRRLFSAYCAFGVGLWISLQSFVSMGVNLGVLPTKGLTLPLVSSGGSSVLMTCAAFGPRSSRSRSISTQPRPVPLTPISDSTF